jgi:hypothetical protein
MESGNTFSLQRLMLLFKQSFTINKKQLAITIISIAAIFFVILVLSQSAAQFVKWRPSNGLILFEIFFFAFGIVYSSFAFPAFRTKEKTMSYLMLPVSTLEKFTFEFLTRIVAFILFMPLLFLIVANLEGIIVHHFVPELTYYKFSFGTAWKDLNNHQVKGWIMFGYIQTALFAFIVAFTGASYFSKAPLMKTIFTFSIVQVTGILFIYLLSKGLNLKGNDLSGQNILFIKNEADAVVFYALSALAVNLTLLSIAWFSLKEKEA